MHRTPLLKTLIFFTIFACLLTSVVFCQTKPSGEVDVTKCWAYPLGDAPGEALASDGSRVFLGLRGAEIEALSIDGKKMWASELGGDISSNILVLDIGVFLVTSTVSSDVGKPGGSVLRSLSKETGITNWTLKLSNAENYYLGGFNGAIVIVSKSGVIQSIDAKKGTLRWKREIAEVFATGPAFNGGKVIVATTAKQIFVISIASGEIDSMRKVPFGVTALGMTPSGEIIAGDERGNVLSLVNGTEKPYWKFKSGGEISAVFAVGDHLLLTSHDNFVYFLVSRNGGMVWKKRLTGRVSQIAMYTDRFALITSFEGHSAVLTNLSNGKVAGQIAFTEDENLVYSHVMSNGLIFTITNKAVNVFSLNGCSTNKDGGAGKQPATANLK